ncbi:hypothetical protein niasHS_012298 [Heterodera schachtii]|uniref:RNA-dependent RNA polymerase n=1 Tax=Heterodera schachtii TaxID=97005 RepID=A0ABD2IW37_HETSC
MKFQIPIPSSLGRAMFEVVDESGQTHCPVQPPNDNIIFVTWSYSRVTDRAHTPTILQETGIELERRFYATSFDYLGGRDSKDEPYCFSDGIRFRGFKGVLSVDKTVTLDVLEQVLAEIDKGLDCLHPSLINDWIFKRVNRSADAMRQIQDENTKEGLYASEKVMITPSRMLFVAPELLMGNRVLRMDPKKYPLDKFLRVVFRDDDGRPVHATNETGIELERRFYATSFDYLGGRDSKDEPYCFSDGVGSGLGGAEYTVIWDEQLHLDRNEDAFDYSTKGVEAEAVNEEDLRQKMAKFFVDYIKQDSIGRIANAFLINSDLFGIKSEHMEAVYFPKTGVPPKPLTNKWESVNAENEDAPGKPTVIPPERAERSPDFMKKNNVPMHVSVY